MHRGSRYLCLMGVIAAAYAQAPGADTLYRWLDEQGRTHFSDRPPPGHARSAEQLALPAYIPPERPADEDPYSIMNQLGRLEDARQRLLRERLERQQRDRDFQLRQRELEARTQMPPPATGAPVYVHPWPGYRPLPGQVPIWPVQPTHPRSLWQPDHPAYRPAPGPHQPRRPYGIEFRH